MRLPRARRTVDSESNPHHGVDREVISVDYM